MADTAINLQSTNNVDDYPVLDVGIGLQNIDLGFNDLGLTVNAGKDTQKDAYAESVEQVIQWLQLGQNSKSAPLPKYCDLHNRITATQKGFMTHHDRLRGHNCTHRLPMPAVVQLTHVVDFAMSFGAVSAKLFSELGLDRKNHFLNGKTPKYLAAVNPKAMWKQMYKSMFPKLDYGNYVDNQWRRGWIAIFNYVTLFPCLKLLQYAPLENIVTVADTLYTVVKTIDDRLDHAVTDEDVKTALDQYHHGWDADL